MEFICFTTLLEKINNFKINYNSYYPIEIYYNSLDKTGKINYKKYIDPNGIKIANNSNELKDLINNLLNNDDDIIRLISDLLYEAELKDKLINKK